MKAKISYTVNLEEIPQEVSELVQKLQFVVEKNVTSKLSEIYPIDSDTIADSIESIDKVRRSIAEIDLRLEDCYSILLGYHQAVNRGFHKLKDTQELSEKLSELGENLEHQKQEHGSNQ